MDKQPSAAAVGPRSASDRFHFWLSSSARRDRVYRPERSPSSPGHRNTLVIRGELAARITNDLDGFDDFAEVVVRIRRLKNDDAVVIARRGRRAVAPRSL